MSNRLIIQLYRGNTTQNNQYTGSSGELTIDTEKRRLRIHDGVNAGGTELAKLEDTLSSVEIEALIETGLITYASLNGDLTENFNVNVLYTANGILPTAVGQDIGSSTNRFNAIYVDEAYLSTNTLYIGDTPIIGTDADTVIIKADLNQSITINTTGSGETTLQSARGIALLTSGDNADVEVVASGNGAKARFTATQGVDITTPTTTFYSDVVVKQNQSVTGNLTVTGNVTVNGDSFIVNAGTVATEDNIILVNRGEIGSGVTAGKAGIQVDRGEVTDYQIVFDEVDDYFKVGMVGDLETIASQEWVIANSSNSTHNHIDATTTVSGFLSAADKSKLNGIETGATADQTKADIDALGVNAATVGGKTVLVDVPAGAVFTDTVYNDSALVTTLNTKVDKVAGKGLTTEDYSTAEKTKLAGIATGAQVNVGTNLGLTSLGDTQTLTSSTGTSTVLPIGSTMTAGLMAVADKTKLDGIATGAQVNSVTSVAGKQGAVTLVKADVGLGNVANTADTDKPVSTPQQTALDLKVDKIPGKGLSVNDYSTAEKTKLAGIATGAEVNIGTNISLTGSGDSWSIVSSTGTGTSVSLASTTAAGLISIADKTKLDSIATGAQVNSVTSVAGRTGAVVLTKTDVGLSGVDNTSDTAKPVSTAQQTALDLKLNANANAVSATKLVTARTVSLSGDVTGSATFDGSANVSITAVIVDDSHNHTIDNVDGLQTAINARIASSEKGAANGVASLDASGLVPAAQLPSYVDDVLEYANFAGLPVTGITGKIYVALDTNKIYRWSGSAYIEISATAGNSDTATKLTTARTIALSGDVTGSTTFDGSANVTIAAVIADDSHNHIIDNVDGLQTALDAKLASTANAVSATKLATARTINGVAFDGTAAITVADSTKLPLTGGTVTGQLTLNSSLFLNGAPSGTEGGEIFLQPATGNVKGAVILDNFDGHFRAFNVTSGYTYMLDVFNGGIGFNGSTVWHAGNDGVGSGLDADLLDGLQSATANTASTIVARDASGNFSAGTITATLNGNASSATNATTVGGLAVSAGINNVANNIVKTDVNGYIQAGYISSGNGNEGNNSSPGRVWGTNGSDAFLRSYLTTALVAGSATKLATARTIGMTGDVTWTSPTFDGTGNVTATATLANVATAGTYRSVTVDAKGRVTSGTNPTTLAGYGITDAIKKYAANVGNGSNTVFTIAHNLNTVDLTASVRLVASTYDFVYPDIQIVDSNNIKLIFTSAPTTGQYRVVVIG
jgi:hypothetical protein